MTNFKTKNENRKAHKGTTEHREARTLRRRLGGAFGNEPKERFNALAVGTTGDPR